MPSSTSRSRSRSAAAGCAHECERAADRAGTDGARQRPEALLRADAHADAERLQAEVLRLGAGLPVAADAAADAVRRPLRGLHALREVREGRGVLPGDAAARNR